MERPAGVLSPNRTGPTGPAIPGEIDDDPPRVRLPYAQWFAHYFRLDGFRTRLDAILRDVSFVPLRALSGETEVG